MSSDDSAKLLQRWEADYVLDCHETPAWSSQASEFTGDVGVDVVVFVSGPTSFKQSAAAVKLDGFIKVTEFIGKEGKSMLSWLGCWIRFFTASGVWVGSCQQMEDMCRVVKADAEKPRPAVDLNVFSWSKSRRRMERTSGKALLRNLAIFFFSSELVAALKRWRAALVALSKSGVRTFSERTAAEVKKIASTCPSA